MRRFGDRWGRLLGPAADIQPGIYPFKRELNGYMLRLQLRVEPDGSGVLVVNASAILHLNSTATLLMKLMLEGSSKADAVAFVRKRYRGGADHIAEDYDRILNIITELETSEDACPVWNLDIKEISPFGNKLSAPYRADLALTYKCNNQCMHCYVPRKPDDKVSLDLEQWKSVLDRLWAAGVPHICFTGGEATMYPYLPELIERAEDIGQVTGLLSNGRKLADRDYVRRLCGAGLDHVQITLESFDEAIHDQMVCSQGAFKETVQGIKNAIDDDIYLLTNTTLCDLNRDGVEETIQFIADLGVRQFAMNSFICTGSAPSSGAGIDEFELAELVDRVVCKAEDVGLRFIWYTPTHYCRFNPAEHGVGIKRCSAAEYNICIEPDGDVIPCQSYFESAGNILTDPWKSIWHSDIFERIRSRSEAAPECRTCPDFGLCGSGCPLSKGDRFLCHDSTSA